MTSLSQLKCPKGSTQSKTRVGRGQGSGLGKTAGRGGKGQKARSGNMHFAGFEGGQMPLQRRMPKFGFTNFFRREFAVINIGTLDAHFEAGAVVDAAALEKAGFVKDHKNGLKILGGGELKKALTVKANKISESAKLAIEKAGGKVELIVEKELKLPARGQGVKKRLAKERVARRAAGAAKHKA
jgi:large subunit ribosomal protein L15